MVATWENKVARAGKGTQRVEGLRGKGGAWGMEGGRSLSKEMKRRCDDMSTLLQ
ncbi:hypothetical protein CCACVL1_28375 [Corchorus capsularis]|uniref:Uncharacterized protein n=1 Tax=Corchorus capsularis TaxID=210143 RepID=A0A1R3G6S3_COCAP|nr:hypothetical protein CCACVL1_28375 [Corchorus capsularis]